MTANTQVTIRPRPTAELTRLATATELQIENMAEDAHNSKDLIKAAEAKDKLVRIQAILHDPNNKPAVKANYASLAVPSRKIIAADPNLKPQRLTQGSERYSMNKPWRDMVDSALRSQIESMVSASVIRTSELVSELTKAAYHLTKNVGSIPSYLIQNKEIRIHLLLNADLSKEQALMMIDGIADPEKHPLLGYEARKAVNCSYEGDRRFCEAISQKARFRRWPKSYGHMLDRAAELTSAQLPAKESVTAKTVSIRQVFELFDSVVFRPKLIAGLESTGFPNCLRRELNNRCIYTLDQLLVRHHAERYLGSLPLRD